MIDLGTLGGNWSSAEAVNDRGEVFGRSLTRDGAMHAFLWSDGRMSDLGAFDVYAGAGGVNRGGIAVGTNWDQAVVVVGGRAAALPSLGGVCQAVAINDRGVVTGSCDLKGWSHAVVWTRR